MPFPVSPVYCTSADVWAMCQRSGGTDFSTTTFPTQTTVNDYIMRSEREIERRTGTAWKVLANQDTDSQDGEYHDLGPPWSYFNFGLIHKPRIQLMHRNIVTPLSLGAGDSLKLTFGGDFTEQLGVWTEGRGSNYWINATEGIIYFNTGFPIVRFPDGIVVKYRYGRSSVDPWVKDIACKMAAVMVLEFDTKTMVAAGGAGNPAILSTEARVQNLKDEIETKLAKEDFLNYLEKKPLII